MKDLFGKEVRKITNLRQRYIVPPFSVLDANNTEWKKRKRSWKKLGIQSEMGRNTDIYEVSKKDNFLANKANKSFNAVSLFDPVLCEVMYHWFSAKNDKILDPFAGGSVRGIVASKMNRKYVGIELRPEQIKANITQAKNIIKDTPKPKWIQGDSNKELNQIKDNNFDFIFSCPPYWNLEIYSDMKNDISNLSYKEFLKIYGNIINKSIQKLKQGKYATFVVGEFRDKNQYGGYLGFVPSTIKAFQDAGCLFYNEIILYTALGMAPYRAENNMKNQKVVKVHQNVLVFRKE